MTRSLGQTVGRTLGVLGGMGPAATLDFLAKLQRVTPAASDQGHIHVLVDLNPQVPDRNAALAGSGPSPGPVLAQMARGLEAAGAEGLVMVCNSAHAFTAEVRAAVKAAPLISLIDETVAEVHRSAPHVRQVGVLAASACLDAKLYQDAFERTGVTTIVPHGELRQTFMTLLYRIKAGETGAKARKEMVDIAQALACAGAEVIVSGCTEVPLVLSKDDLDLPLVDSTDVLVAAALAFARPDAG
jgi:aspartate racemase